MATLLQIAIMVCMIVVAAIFQFAYFGKVVPALTRRGYKPDWPVWGSAQIRRVKEYARICREEGHSLRWYNVLLWSWPVLLVLFAAFVWVGIHIDLGRQ